MDFVSASLGTRFLLCLFQFEYVWATCHVVLSEDGETVTKRVDAACCTLRFCSRGSYSVRILVGLQTVIAAFVSFVIQAIARTVPINMPC
jgi:hypothetical protein